MLQAEYPRTDPKHSQPYISQMRNFKRQLRTDMYSVLDFRATDVDLKFRELGKPKCT